MLEEKIANVYNFNVAFNNLHDTIKEKMAYPQRDKFKELIDSARKNNDKIIAHYYDRLKLINDLRNVVIHKNKDVQTILSVPSDEIIEEIKYISDKISNPKKVRDLFLSPVITYKKDDMLSDVLRVVKDKKYSQFPVFDNNKLIGIITENGITNYLAYMIDEDLISFNETTLSEIIDSDESVDSYEVIYENKSIYDIEEIFNKQIKNGNTTFILLITKKANNKVTNKNDIVGIITPWDIPRLMDNK